MNDMVTIVIPVYKVEDYIENTLRSVVAQSYKYIEVILVDDGTPDASVVVAEAFLKDKDVNWKVIHQNNSGLSAARNRGIAEAKGDWIICVDSDDYIVPETVECLLLEAKKHDSLCAFCKYKSVNNENIDAGVIHEGEVKLYSSKVMRQLFLERKIKLIVPGMLLHRSLYEYLQYDTSCPYDEDIHFLWQLLFLCESVVYIDSACYNYLSRSTSMVHTLRPEHYLETSSAYARMVQGFLVKYPSEREIVNCIHPKYRLGGLHVLAKSTEYSVFKQTVFQDGYRKDMNYLLHQKDVKLRLLTLMYCISLRAFYQVCKKG